MSKKTQRKPSARTRTGSQTGDTIALKAERIGEPKSALGGSQVIIRLVNHHGSSIGGKVYARVGLTEKMEKLVAVLPDKTNTFDFRHATGTITRVWTDELACSHTKQHGFSFDIPNPESGKTYEITFD